MVHTRARSPCLSWKDSKISLMESEIVDNVFYKLYSNPPRISCTHATSKLCTVYIHVDITSNCYIGLCSA